MSSQDFTTSIYSDLKLQGVKNKKRVSKRVKFLILRDAPKKKTGIFGDKCAKGR